MSDRKVKVPAEVALRPIESFDVQSGGWCAFHPHADTTHVATVSALAFGLLTWVGIFAALANPSLIVAGVFVGAVTWGVWQVARTSERADARKRNGR